jgi:hypothetical protein
MTIMNRRHIPEEKVDLHVMDQGTIFLLTPMTQRATYWVAENIGAGEDVATWGSSIIVEHRYIADIVEGAIADGLKVQGAS